MMLPTPQLRLEAAVIYNMLAFALPALLGLLADLAGKNAFTSCLGCLLIFLCYIITPGPWSAVALIGVGNGLFHIGGGRQILQDSMPKYAPSGIFISSGALGVFLGKTLSGAFRHWVYILIWAVLAACVILLAFCGIRQNPSGKRSKLSSQKTGAKMLMLSVMIFIVVIIRSYYGFAAAYPWNNGFTTGLIFTICIVAGKFLGGIAADRFGVCAAAAVSLGGSGILALFSFGSPVAGCASILLFNMTMPVTLTLLTGLWNELPGFAFGVLMLALFLGTLPNMVWKISWMSSPAGLLGLCLISLALLLGVIKMEERKCTFSGC